MIRLQSLDDFGFGKSIALIDVTHRWREAPLRYLFVYVPSTKFAVVVGLPEVTGRNV